MTKEIKTIGILGGGQLGRMLALAAYDLGRKCVIWDTDENACALEVTKNGIVASYDDKDALKKFTDEADVVLLEFENIPVELVEAIEKKNILVAPSSKALSIVQDRKKEKTFFDDNKILCADWHFVDSEESAREADKKLGYPLVLKTTRFGYDGKGQIICDGSSKGKNILSAWYELGEVDCIAEKLIPFDKEVSIIGARSTEGITSIYDIAENVHKDHILDISTVPANISKKAQEKADEYIHTAMEALDVVGLLALEMFVVGDDILANEMAARPHNSGHWTMDGAATSQFEQCIRSVITDWGFSSCERLADVRMKNLLGGDVKYTNFPDDYNYEKHKAHLYGKNEIRSGRKMGHINFFTRIKNG